MDSSIVHLLWGVSLFCLYVVVASMEISLLKSCEMMTLSQTLALIFVGELASMVPVFPVVWRHRGLANRCHTIIGKFYRLTNFLSLDKTCFVLCIIHKSVCWSVD